MNIYFQAGSFQQGFNSFYFSFFFIQRKKIEENSRDIRDALNALGVTNVNLIDVSVVSAYLPRLTIPVNTSIELIVNSAAELYCSALDVSKSSVISLLVKLASGGFPVCPQNTELLAQLNDAITYIRQEKISCKLLADNKFCFPPNVDAEEIQNNECWGDPRIPQC